MRYVAIYRRETDPQMSGTPVALFRDPGLMGAWAQTTTGVHDREFVTRDLELPDEVALELAVVEHYELTAPPTSPAMDAGAFAQLVAEEKAKMTRDIMTYDARRQAQQELQDAGLLPPPMTVGPSEGFGYRDGISPLPLEDDEAVEAEMTAEEEAAALATLGGSNPTMADGIGKEEAERTNSVPPITPITNTPTMSTPDAFGSNPDTRLSNLNEQSGGIVTPEDEASSKANESGAPTE